MSDHQCVLCARRGRKRTLTEGHVCGPGRNGLRVDLGQILDFVALAATMPDPFASRTAGAGARPRMISTACAASCRLHTRSSPKAPRSRLGRSDYSPT